MDGARKVRTFEEKISSKNGDVSVAGIANAGYIEAKNGTVEVIDAFDSLIVAKKVVLK